MIRLLDIKGGGRVLASSDYEMADTQPDLPGKEQDRT